MHALSRIVGERENWMPDRERRLPTQQSEGRKRTSDLFALSPSVGVSSDDIDIAVWRGGVDFVEPRGSFADDIFAHFDCPKVFQGCTCFFVACILISSGSDTERNLPKNCSVSGHFLSAAPLFEKV